VFAGIPGLLGADISGSLAFGLPEASLKGFEETIFGVFGGLGDKMNNAWKSYEAGNYSRMAESALPVAGESLMKAFRLHYEGAKTISGKRIFDTRGNQIKLSERETFIQALGLKPTKLGKAYLVKNVAFNVEQHYKHERDKIYNQMRNTTDVDKWSGIVERINEYNRDISQFGGAIRPITSRSIAQAHKERIDKMMMHIGMVMKID
jgi:hypothetical protein